MNRHAKITERVEKKNNILHFYENTPQSVQRLIKKYEKLRLQSLQKQLNKLTEQDNDLFIEKICKFQNELAKNEQLKNIILNLSTYNRVFDDVLTTPLSKFCFRKNIARF